MVGDSEVISNALIMPLVLPGTARCPGPSFAAGTMRLRVGGVGSGREGFVSAFNVDDGNLCAHRAEIRQELAAMMRGMADPETQIGDGRVVQKADVVNWCGKVLAGQPFETWQALREVFVIPTGNVSARL